MCQEWVRDANEFADWMDEVTRLMGDEQQQDAVAEEQQQTEDEVPF